MWKNNASIQFLLKLGRNSPWLLSAILIHVIIGFALAIVYVKQHFEKDEGRTIQVDVSTSGKAADEPIIQPPEQIDRKAIPKNEDAELVSFEEQTYIPSDEAPEEVDLHLDVGDPNATDDAPPGATGGTAIGVGVGAGHYASGGPSAYASRRAGGGGKGRRAGPTQGTEKSVLEGLRWLIRHQSPDGAWHAATLAEVCAPGHSCLPADAEPAPYFDEGLTGLALLAFLGAGHGHDSKVRIVDTAMGKEHVIGEVVKNGLKWLRDRQREDGSFSEVRTFMYNEALAAMALCEAYGLTQARYWKDPAELAVQFLIDAQLISPLDQGRWGWRYSSLKHLQAQKESGELGDAKFEAEAHEADISVTCLVIMALKSARLSGFEVPEEVFQGGLRFAKYVTGQEGLVGYLQPQEAGRKISGLGDHFTYHPTTMTALGMLVRTFVERDASDPFLELGAQRIIEDLPAVSKDGLSIDYYNWYYATLALHQFDGPESTREGKKGVYWEPWNKAMIKAIIELQDTKKQRDVCNLGGWLVGDRWALQGGPIYATAINTLTLEVYYRFENAFGTADREKAAMRGAPIAAEENEEQEQR